MGGKHKGRKENEETRKSVLRGRAHRGIGSGNRSWDSGSRIPSLYE
jgi:hypothetical protein